MSLLVEGISVIIKRNIIDKKYPGGWEKFVKDVPNRTFCHDDIIARVGFMVPVDVEGYIEHLKGLGFQYILDEEAVDLVVVDQIRGKCMKCAWLQVLYFDIDDDPKKRVTACQVTGEDTGLLYTPDNWIYENSLSNRYGFIPTCHEDKSLKYLGCKDGLDVYLNVLTGKECYVGRVGNKKT